MNELKNPDEYQALVRERQDKNPFLPIHAIVRDIIRERIMNCDLAPGRHLKETDLSLELGVSRTTVRNALDVLWEQGLLEKDRRRGLCVLGISRAQCRQISEFRRQVDPIIAGFAALRRTMDDLSRLRGFLADGMADSPEAFMEADNQFHYAIYVAAKNQYFLTAYDRVNVDRKRMNYFAIDNLSKTDLWVFQANKRDRMRESHAGIFDAIERADLEAAKTLARRHTELSLFDFEEFAK